MNKRVLSFILSLVLLLSVLTGLSLSASSATTLDNVNCGAKGTNAKCSYNASTKTLTITGTGAIKDYGTSSLKRAPWYDLKSEIVNVVIGEGIDTVGQLNFYNCTALKSVSLPSTLTTLRGGTLNYGAFRECTALESIELPEGLTTIDDMAFRGCSSLKSITIPGTVTTIGLSICQDCSDLETVTFGEGMTFTGYESFRDSGVKYVNFPSTMQVISGWCFYNTRISSVVIPESVTEIGTRAFAQCEHISSVTVYNPNTEFKGLIKLDSGVGEDPFSGSPQTVTFYGHSGSTTQTYVNEKNANIVGNDYRFVSIDPCDHESTHEVITVEPTCTETGVKTYVCDNCGFTVSQEEIPANGHTYVLDETDDKTELDGHIYKTYVCSVCGNENKTIEHIKNVEGFYTYTNTATCTRPGIETYTCTVENCGHVERHVVNSSHKVEEWTVTAEPDCTNEGSQTGVCTVCGETVTQSIPALGHTNELVDTIDNTEEDGHTYDVYSCTVCGEQTIEAHHVEWVEGFYESTVITAPRCVVNGVGRDTCTVDGCGETRLTTLPANGQHDWYETSRNEPTCTARGAVFYACHNCTLTKQEPIEALGHDYVRDEEKSVDATCTADGSDFMRCTRCSATSTVVVPATGHTPVAETYSVISEPTCTKEGKAHGTCSVCNEEYDITLDALGHDYQPVETAIDGKPGHVLSTPTCTRCGRTDTATTVHKEWIDGYYTSQVITEGNCTVAQISRDTCTICGETRNNTTPAPGHNYNCTGLNESGSFGFTCSVCGNETTRTPAFINATWNVRYVNHSPSEFTLGYMLDVSNDKIINAKDYAIIRQAYLANQQTDGT